MANSQIIVGLDVGTTKIAAIVGRKNEFGKIEILGIGKTESVGVMRGMVSNIDKTVNSIRKAVEEAEIKSSVEIKVVNVGIAGQHIKSLQHNQNIMRDKIQEEISQKDIDRLFDNVRKIALPPGEEIIQILPQEYIVDKEYGIKDPIGMFGSCLAANFHIITGQVAAASNLYRCVERAGLRLSDIVLEPLASADAVLSDEEKEAGVVLVDIGGGTTDIAIFHEGIIRHTAVIPFGGNVITDDIKAGCSIIKNQAEVLKVKFGSALASENKDEEIVSIPGLRGRDPKEISLRNLANIIQARMQEILEFVHYEIKSSGFEKKLIAGIVLTGGGAQLKHIAQLTEYVTGMETRIGYPNEHLSSTVPDEISSPIYSTGIGLVIKGFESLKEKEELYLSESETAKQFETEGEAEHSDVSAHEPPQHVEPKQPKESFFDKIKKIFEGIQ
ncbi:MAG: cell division protein FtsA [Bacteroidota bacterium]|nr:cell division protein FtsA [Bacteroidota bacterium]